MASLHYMPEIASCRHHSRVHRGVCAVLSPPPVYPSPPSTSPLATTGLFPVVKSVSWMVSLLKNSHFGGLPWPRIRKGFDPLKYPTQASLCCLQASSVLLFGPTSSCHHGPYFRTSFQGAQGYCGHCGQYFQPVFTSSGQRATLDSGWGESALRPE